MPADEFFVRLLLASLHNRSARIVEAPVPDAAPNPFRLRFEIHGEPYAARIHVRRVTPQRGAGTDHARPAGEWHAQMIFDDSQRGAGVRNTLRADPDPDVVTLLCGFARIEEESVIVAWDPARHVEYAYSKSLQVREETLATAVHDGIAQQPRTTGEIIVAFRPEFLPTYFQHYSVWHDTIEPSVAVDLEVEMMEQQREETPPDALGERERRRLAGTQAIRDARFQRFIHREYGQCATCGLGVETVLEAAHIIPVTDPQGTDHFSNGFLLCRNCHALFDAGLLRILPTYEIQISADLAGGESARLRRDIREQLILPAIPEEFLPDPEKLAYVLDR